MTTSKPSSCSVRLPGLWRVLFIVTGFLMIAGSAAAQDPCTDPCDSPSVYQQGDRVIKLCTDPLRVIQICDSCTGTILRTISYPELEGDPIINFSGNTLVICYPDPLGAVDLINLETGKTTQVVENLLGDKSVLVSPTCIAIMHFDSGQVIIANGATGQVVHTVINCPNPAVQFAHDRVLVYCPDSETVIVVDNSTGQVLSGIESISLNSSYYSSEQGFVVYDPVTDLVYVINPVTGQVVATRNCEGQIPYVVFAGSTVIIKCGNTIWIIDGLTGNQLNMITGDIIVHSTSEDTIVLAIPGADSDEVQIINAATGQPVLTITCETFFTEFVPGRVVLVCRNGDTWTTMLIDCASGKTLYTLQQPAKNLNSPYINKSECCLIIIEDELVRIVRTDTGMETVILPIPPSAGSFEVYQAGGQVLIYYKDQGRADLYDCKTGMILESFEGIGNDAIIEVDEAHGVIHVSGSGESLGGFNDGDVVVFEMLTGAICDVFPACATEATYLGEQCVSVDCSDGSLLGTDCLPDCLQDLDNSGTVDAADLALVLGAWGLNPGHPADLNGDTIVNAADLALILGNWGSCES